MVRYNEIVNEISNRSRISRTFENWFSDYNSYTIDDKNMVIVDGNCAFTNESLDKIPAIIKEVSGNFHCNETSISSLEGSPQIINGSYYCRHNDNLTSLKGFVSVIKGILHCSLNQNLESLDGCDARIDTAVRLSYCPKLKLTLADEIPIDTPYVMIPYTHDLPILRIFSEDYYKSKVQLSMNTCPKELKAVIQDLYLGPKGKKAIYEAQYALIKAGFKDNAKW